MFNKNNFVFREVNYNYLYKNTLNLINIRKYNKLNYGLCNIQILFWYKHIPAESFDIFKLYNNIMLLWLIFKQKAIVIKYGSSFRLNVYYNRALLISNINRKKILKFFDIFVNGFLPCIRKISIKFIFLNQKLIIDISDLSFFTSIKMGRFFYVENVIDNILFNFNMNNNIVNYLTIFKINGI